MAKIRRLTLFDIKKLQKFVEDSASGIPSNLISERNFTPFPVDVIHDFLPVGKKFLQECYVATEGNDILGLVGVVPDGAEKNRWKINRLVLNTRSFDVGRQLIDYVVNKYGGAGVETFIAFIDEQYIDALALLKNVCAFRGCGQVKVWQQGEYVQLSSADYSNFRAYNPSDASKILQLHQQSLFPQFKHSLIKNIRDFKVSNLANMLCSNKASQIKRVVLEDQKKNTIEAYFTISTTDGKKFYLDPFVSMPYLDYYEDIINFALDYIKSINESNELFVYSRHYFQGSPRQEEILNNANFKCIKTQQVLVKDYWQPAKLAADEKKSPIVIFPEGSTACNITEI